MWVQRQSMPKRIGLRGMAKGVLPAEMRARNGVDKRRRAAIEAFLHIFEKRVDVRQAVVLPAIVAVDARQMGHNGDVIVVELGKFFPFLGIEIPLFRGVGLGQRDKVQEIAVFIAG